MDVWIMGLAIFAGLLGAGAGLVWNHNRFLAIWLFYATGVIGFLPLFLFWHQKLLADARNAADQAVVQSGGKSAATDVKQEALRLAVRIDDLRNKHQLRYDRLSEIQRQHPNDLHYRDVKASIREEIAREWQKELKAEADRVRLELATRQLDTSSLHSQLQMAATGGVAPHDLEKLAAEFRKLAEKISS